VEEHSPYQASDATTVPDDAQLRANRLPQDISGPIKTMWVTGYVMATFALLISLILAFMMFRRLELGDVSTVEVLLTAGGAMLDAVVFAALSWAIRRHSRIAAWSILGYYLVGQALFLMQSSGAALFRLAVVTAVLIIFIRGLIAMNAYHRHLRRESHRPARGRISDDPAFAHKADPAP
jgi:hypothetical protein